MAYRTNGLQCKVLLGPMASRGQWLTGLAAFRTRLEPRARGTSGTRERGTCVCVLKTGWCGEGVVDRCVAVHTVTARGRLSGTAAAPSCVLRITL